jgi:hypothetical protein
MYSNAAPERAGDFRVINADKQEKLKCPRFEWIWFRRYRVLSCGPNLAERLLKFSSRLCGEIEFDMRFLLAK